MKKIIFGVLVATILCAVPGEAQRSGGGGSSGGAGSQGGGAGSGSGGGKTTDSIPASHKPPAGLCRVWISGVNPDKQPAPTDCATAVRNVPANARVIFGEPATGRGGKTPPGLPTMLPGKTPPPTTGGKVIPPRTFPPRQDTSFRQLNWRRS